MSTNNTAVGYTFFWIGMKIDSSGEYWNRAEDKYGKFYYGKRIKLS